MKMVNAYAKGKASQASRIADGTAPTCADFSSSSALSLFSIQEERDGGPGRFACPGGAHSGTLPGYAPQADIAAARLTWKSASAGSQESGQVIMLAPLDRGPELPAFGLQLADLRRRGSRALRIVDLTTQDRQPRLQFA